MPLCRSDTVLEIGCGVGRMTHRLAEHSGSVIAADVSDGMLGRCRANCWRYPNVDYLLLPGDGTLPFVPDGSIDVVFSYITLQHVPSAEAQMRYLAEGVRTLGAGGTLLVQLRGTSAEAVVLDWLGHVRHALSGRPTLQQCWRGGRLEPRHALAAVGARDVRAELQPFGRRHVWVVAHKA